MTVLAETWTVTIAYEWMKKFGEEHDGSRFTFASLRGCQEYVDMAMTKDGNDTVLWYAIEGVQHIPCDESKPWGQTYQGMIHHEFHDLQDQNSPL